MNALKGQTVRRGSQDVEKCITAGTPFPGSICFRFIVFYVS